MGVVISRSLGFAAVDARLKLPELGGMSALDLEPVVFTRAHHLFKRAVDVALSCSLLILLTPLLIFIAAAVRLTSAGPILYKAPRVGRGGRHVTFLKFRSMYDDRKDRALVAAQNEAQGHAFKIRQDPRVTPVGRFIRRYSLDELPQLFNVILGDMSLVGPRPLPAEDLDTDGQSDKFAAWAEQRSTVPPGITGLWQVSGRSDLSFNSWFELDLYYIKNWSLSLDLQILLQTPLVVISGRGAYY